jgi:hypothetical protein
MDVRYELLLREQDDLLAWWQLRALGWSARRIEDIAWRHRWQAIHPGVYARCRARLTRRQRWIAATLTAPGTMLMGASAGARWGFRPWESAFETVVRPGSGGPRRFGGVLVARSSTLAADIDWHRGIPITSAERTLIDLSAGLDDRARARAVREAIRLGVTTAPAILEACARHRGRRGVAPLRVLAELYAQLPLARARSDAESLALERIFLAGGTLPELNVKVAGFEADLVDHERKLIVEVDGPQYHLFPDEDARKERAWNGEGYEVLRVPSGDVYG